MSWLEMAAAYAFIAIGVILAVAFVLQQCWCKEKIGGCGMFKKVLGWTLGILIVGGVLFLLFGGGTWLWSLAFPPKPELRAEPIEREWWERALVENVRCSDGTMYVLTTEGSAFWLVNGKVVKVACEEGLDWWYYVETQEGPCTDSSGGLYLKGKKHLWYLRGGRANKVEETSLENITPSDNAVTRETILWEAVRRYGDHAYKIGYDSGHESGYDAGYDAASE